jgi:hypothetical protein
LIHSSSRACIRAADPAGRAADPGAAHSGADPEKVGELEALLDEPLEALPDGTPPDGAPPAPDPPQAAIPSDAAIRRLRGRFRAWRAVICTTPNQHFHAMPQGSGPFRDLGGKQ